MIDVNPMEPSGVELWVLEFCRFFLLWCAFGSDTLTLRNEQQVQCYQNFKNAARYDLNSATVTLPDGMVKTVQEAAPGESCARLVFESDFLIFVSAALQVSFYSSLEYSEKYTLTNSQICHLLPLNQAENTLF